MQRSCIQFITNKQGKLIPFIREGVDFTLGIRYVPLTSEGPDLTQVLVIPRILYENGSRACYPPNLAAIVAGMGLPPLQTYYML